MNKLLSIISVFLALVLVVGSDNVFGQGSETAVSNESAVLSSASENKSLPTNQIIIKFSDEARLMNVDFDKQMTTLSQVAGVELVYFRPMSGDAHVLRLPEKMAVRDVAKIASDLTSLPEVAFAEPDLVMTIDSHPDLDSLTPSLIPIDPHWNAMWHLKYTPNNSEEGINVIPAWDITTGDSSTVVAVIDTGILNHTDLVDRTVPGYDFISDVAAANDGDGRDNNPSDPGDWCSLYGLPSSWHGTHVAGTIGAKANNNLGIVGINWNAKILPVRVLGQCGGLTSDILDAMRWSAGLSVTGVSNNPNPADVLNLSLGGEGSCPASYQSAINEIVASGVTVVVASGNSNTNAASITPANCDNVISVAATARNGDKAYYSNYGSVIKVSAPGGEVSTSDANGVLSTLDSGTTTPNNDNIYAFYQGTSMAAPHVTGLVSLIKGMQPDYTPAQVLSLLQSTARSFPAGSTCSTSNCGTGIVDANRALTLLNINFTDFVYLPIVVQVESSSPPPPSNPITNPGFESGQTGWTEFSSHGWSIITSSSYPSGISPHGGNWLAWLGGDLDDFSFVEQQVTVPAAAPHLTYWQWIASEDAWGYDFGGVIVNGTVVDVYSLCESTNTGGWAKHSVNLSAYAGQTVTFQVRVETDDSLNSNMFLDDLSFQAAPTLTSTFSPHVDLGETAVRR